MKIKAILFLIIIGLFAFSSAYSQEEDSTDTGWGHWKHHNFEFTFFNGEFEGRPTVSFLYGFSKINMENLPELPSKPNLIELKLGYTSINHTWEDENIIRYRYRFGYVSNFSTDLSGKNSSADIKSNMWRFGFGRSTGYGYDLGSFAIIPYHSYSVDWSQVKFTNLSSNSADQKLLDPFNNNYRFGTSMEGGIKIQIIKHFMIDGAYERSIIFPRHLFWKWAGSVAVEVLGQVALDNFIDEIKDSSPYAAPVMSFLLKNALSYGIYELRQSKMNWPFSTVAPLAYDQFKVGITFVF